MLFREYPILVAANNKEYRVLLCGDPEERCDGTWEGWIEFHPLRGGRVLRRREPSHPSRAAFLDWAFELELEYLESVLAELSRRST